MNNGMGVILPIFSSELESIKNVQNKRKGIGLILICDF